MYNNELNDHIIFVSDDYSKEWLKVLLERSNLCYIPDDERIIISSYSNPEVLSVLYANGLCANADHMTLAEAKEVTTLGTIFQDNTDITHFEEFRYFTSVTKLERYSFWNCDNLETIIIPESVTELDRNIFGLSSANYQGGHVCKLKYVSGLRNVEKTGHNCMLYCTELVCLDFSSNYTVADGTLALNCSFKTIGDTSQVVNTATNAYFTRSCANLLEISLNCAPAMPSSASLEKINIPWDTIVELPYNFIGQDNVNTDTVGRGADIKVIPDMPNLTTAKTNGNYGALTFYKCLSLEHVGKMPNLTSIGPGMFFGCVKLEDVADLSSAASVLKQGFSSCYALTSLDLPVCATVGDRAFEIITVGADTPCTINFGLDYASITFNSNSFSGRTHTTIICNDVELTAEQYQAVGAQKPE